MIIVIFIERPEETLEQLLLKIHMIQFIMKNYLKCLTAIGIAMFVTLTGLAMVYVIKMGGIIQLDVTTMEEIAVLKHVEAQSVVF